MTGASESPYLARALPPDERLGALVALGELEAIARDRVHRASFDYVAGGSWSEESLAENEAAWKRYRLRPRVLVDVSRIDASTTLLGQPTAIPVAIAPMAAHCLAHPDGEVATARGAEAAGVPFTLSTTSSRSIEDVADAAPNATRWFQLYVQGDPAVTRSLVERAAAAGYRAILLTVDLPLLGYRERDRRSGFDLDIPLGNFVSRGPSHGNHAADGFDLLTDQLERGLTWDDLTTIRSWSSLPLVLKGVMTGEDARLAAEHGVDAIVVSNHGGRQLDRTPAPIDVLEEVAAAAPGTEIWVDGGVRRGLDIAIACALGARGVLVGRPILWALAAGGQAGVERALAILREEFELALTLLGAPTPDALTRDHIA